MKYTSFWWYGNEAPCWGFVLSPRTGRWLRRLIEKNKTPVKVHARVDSRLYAGEMEDCVATIPGVEGDGGRRRPHLPPAAER
jgi:hypothetical protein